MAKDKPYYKTKSILDSVQSNNREKVDWLKNIVTGWQNPKIQNILFILTYLFILYDKE